MASSEVLELFQRVDDLTRTLRVVTAAQHQMQQQLKAADLRFERFASRVDAEINESDRRGGQLCGARQVKELSSQIAGDFKPS